MKRIPLIPGQKVLLLCARPEPCGGGYPSVLPSSLSWLSLTYVRTEETTFWLRTKDGAEGGYDRKYFINPLDLYEVGTITNRLNALVEWVWRTRGRELEKKRKRKK